ncbi:MAG: hypothetical protein R3E12_04685 [Candidatus Eisenbacteria bacterium]
MKTSTLHIVRLVTAASFLPLTGCAMWPQFGEPAFVGPPEPPVLTAEQSPTDRAKDPSGVTPLPGQDYGQNGFEIIFLPRPLPEDKPPVRKRPPTPPVAAAPRRPTR